MAKQAQKSVRNEELYRAMVEIRRSSSTERHVVKSRKGTRATQRKNAIRFGW